VNRLINGLWAVAGVGCGDIGVGCGAGGDGGGVLGAGSGTGGGAGIGAGGTKATFGAAPAFCSTLGGAIGVVEVRASVGFGAAEVVAARESSVGAGLELAVGSGPAGVEAAVATVGLGGGVAAGLARRSRTAVPLTWRP
jgi:hypothetical protein